MGKNLIYKTSKAMGGSLTTMLYDFAIVHGGEPGLCLVPRQRLLFEAVRRLGVPRKSRIMVEDAVSQSSLTSQCAGGVYATATRRACRGSQKRQQPRPRHAGLIA